MDEAAAAPAAAAVDEEAPAPSGKGSNGMELDLPCAASAAAIATAEMAADEENEGEDEEEGEGKGDEEGGCGKCTLRLTVMALPERLSNVSTTCVTPSEVWRSSAPFAAAVAAAADALFVPLGMIHCILTAAGAGWFSAAL